MPEIGASFGKSIREFKKGISDVDRSLREADSSNDRLRPAEPAMQQRKEEEARPEPKRLLG